MPDDADTNVVKVVVREIGDVLLLLRQCVAFIATGLSVEQLPTPLRGVVDGGLVTRDKVIERRIVRYERSFVCGEGTQQIRPVHLAVKDFSESLCVRINA